LQFFARRATHLGLKELVLPLLYVEVQSLHDEAAEDDLIILVRNFQREDWQDLRFLDVTSEGYRRGVARLADRLVKANRHAEKVSVAIALQSEETPDGPVDDSPGLLDRLARAEETLPNLSETLNAIGQNIELIGQAMQEATADIHKADAQGQGSASTRLIIARRVARQLDDPTERIWSLGNEFASQLHDVDEGFRTIIELAPAQIQEAPDSKADVCAFFETVCNLSISARNGLSSAQEMIDAIAPIEKMSRDLRPRMRRLRQGLTTITEARSVSDEWVHLINASGVICEDPDVQKTD
jgi:hypothetical protein